MTPPRKPPPPRRGREGRGKGTAKQRTAKRQRTAGQQAAGKKARAAPRSAGARPRRTALPQLRWNAEPEEVQRSVVKLVLTLVEFLRGLMERQAIRRMEGGTLTPEETERVGVALMRLDETIRDLARRFDIPLEELNLDLGPLGRLR